MPIVNCQASFQNSRQKVRPPTTSADTGTIPSLPAAGAVPLLIRPANVNRTDLTIRNTGGVNLRYGYFPRTSLYQDGFQLRPGDSFDISSPTDVYAVNEAGGAGGEMCWDEGSG